MAIHYGTEAVFHIKYNGQDHYGHIKDISMNHSSMSIPELSMRGFEDESCKEEFEPNRGEVIGIAIGGGLVQIGSPVTATTSKTTKEKEPMRNQRKEAYEYLVINRVEDGTAVTAADAPKDAIIIQPKVILARNVEEVKRIAIREVDKDIDIATVEVVVRPFAE